MSDEGFKSVFSKEIVRFVEFRRTGGCWNNSYEHNLRLFDNYCAEAHPGEELSQAMVDEWCAKRETETRTSRNRRIASVTLFLEYLRERSKKDKAINVPIKLQEEKQKYIPYLFERNELLSFFRECDSIEIHKGCKECIAKKTAAPVFFRLLYSSGIRTTEARLLKRCDVDLKNGVLDIQRTKGYRQHYVALHPSMASLLKEYDAIAEEQSPGREYFFESPRGGFYSSSWVQKTFEECWERANGKQKHHPVPYDLRHNYAIENINSWSGDSFRYIHDINNLARSMGHSNIRSTLYYYTISPGLYDIIERMSSDSLDEVVKILEVEHEEK